MSYPCLFPRLVLLLGALGSLDCAGSSTHDRTGAAGATGAGGASGAPATCSAVSFSDPSVDSAVRAAIADAPHSGPLTQAELAQVVRLSPSHVVALTGVECLSALRELTLYSPQGADLTPLAALPLQTFAAHDGRIAALDALSQVTTLEHVTLNAVAISSLAPLSGLSHLVELSVTNTPLASASPIGELKALQTLVLENTAIDDLSSLAHLDALRTVSISGTQVRDVDSVPAPAPTAKLACFYALGVPLSAHALAEGIPALCARGWAVSWSTPDGNNMGTCNGNCSK